PTYLYAVLSNTYLMNDISDEGIEEDFIRYTGLDTDKYQLSFDMSLSFKDDEADSLTLSSQEKIMALFAGKQIDVFIAPERVMERYLSTDLFQDPREVLGPEEISKLEDMGYKLYYCKYSETLEAEEWDPSTMEDYDICLGINVSNSKYLKTVGSVGAFPEKYGDPIFAFSTVASKEGLEHGIELLNMITKE
nr:hypothetical protein [Lachnospiraceae bacterium]